MATEELTTRLARLHGIPCESVHVVEYEEPPTQAIYSVGTMMRFADGTTIDAQFWRLIKGGRPLVSIFDHGERYGLPAPVDALGMLRGEIVGMRVVDAMMDETTGDLRFRFEGEVELQIFNFTAFEIWQVTFPDGTAELSNYALAK